MGFINVSTMYNAAIIEACTMYLVVKKFFFIIFIFISFKKI